MGRHKTVFRRRTNKETLISMASALNRATCLKIGTDFEDLREIRNAWNAWFKKTKRTHNYQELTYIHIMELRHFMGWTWTKIGEYFCHGYNWAAQNEKDALKRLSDKIQIARDLKRCGYSLLGMKL